MQIFQIGNSCKTRKIKEGEENIFRVLSLYVYSMQGSISIGLPFKICATSRQPQSQSFLSIQAEWIECPQDKNNVHAYEAVERESQARIKMPVLTGCFWSILFYSALLEM